MTDGILGSSFRDPSGFLFEREGILYRHVDASYAPHYDALMGSGLYRELTERGLLVPHELAEGVPSPAGEAHAILRPERVPFVSYPYEWAFSQLKDAALTTLRVQDCALRHGMTLKDASAYNVQFVRGRPVFIDTLSFETLREGRPWVGYRQFCQHFLAPLALMAYRDVGLSRLLRLHLDGIPLGLARSLLPLRAWLNVHLWLHVRLHARYQRRYEGDAGAMARARPATERSRLHLNAALRAAMERLDWKPEGTEWAAYYEGDSYSEKAADHKRRWIEAALDQAAPRRVWDLGANTGRFSRLASDRGIPTLAFDVDPACVERSYREARAAGEEHLLPLLLDLTNPSPALGFAHGERASLLERRSADLVMALALVHHLAIGNNVPLDRVAAYLAALGPRLLIEFVPRGDPKVDRLLATREDVFRDYTREGFERAFGLAYEIEAAEPLEDSERILYRMRRRAA